MKKYHTIEEWLLSDDTGASSKTMMRVCLGIVGDISRPHDPADFGRCYRLRKNIPDIRYSFRKLATLSKERKFIVQNWDHMCFLYEKESDTGRCVELFEYMHQIDNLK